MWRKMMENIFILNPLTALFLSGVGTQLFVLVCDNDQRTKQQRRGPHLKKQSDKQMDRWQICFTNICRELFDIHYLRKVSENPHKKKKSGSGPKQWWPLLENPKIPHQKSQFFCPHKTLFFLHPEQYLRKLSERLFYCDSPNFEMQVCVFAHLLTSQIANSTVS